MSADLKLIHPGIVPIQVLAWLEQAGVTTTEQVHSHIRNGTLQSLPGIGPSREQRIVMMYTDADDWPKVRALYGHKRKQE
jgi:DNA polymerase/3'-5' exonuclease PolX